MTDTYSLDAFVDGEDAHIGLTSVCKVCGGRGKLIDIENETFSPCSNTSCVQGQEITMNGQDLIRFVRKFLDHPSVDAEI